MKPGLLVLHGNRLENLAEVVFEWMARHPLPPLEEETVLVQSNGMAEWFKLSLAASQGICAAMRVELPARFLWRVYRAVLGRNAVPPVSAVDKQPLVWRLMALLPQWLDAHASDPTWAPLAAALGSGERLGERMSAGSAAAGAAAERRLALCQRIADLFDQYQIYRPDWLDDWAAGHDQLRGALYASDGRSQSVPPDQAWQPALWRATLHSLTEAERASMRPALHRRCVQALRPGRSLPQGPAGQRAGLPQRVVLFGSTQLPQSTLELLAALAEHAQIILAVPNPCRYFWADLIDGREQLAISRRRHPLRAGVDLSSVPLQALHAHGHPLLAAWGRQARDFVRQLDAFDDAQRSRERFEWPRVDLFDDGPGTSLLQQVQAFIRDGVPLNEHPKLAPDPDDRSISFHVAHSAQREVEILHDQLLHLLAHPPGRTPLNPRDIVVMVPQIDRFAPAIRAVFGQHPRGSARHIPWGIADVSERGHNPLLQTVEWLMRVPQHRFSVSEWRDLLELPACARRFGIEAADLPQALEWLAGAGVRWGLNEAQRGELGLGAAGGTASWRFGAERMLLGFAAGELADGFEESEPYLEVAGLEAELAGSLAQMAREVESWWSEAHQPRTPQAWAQALRRLLGVFFEAQDERDQAALASLDLALGNWLTACEAAAYDEALALPVVREAWLGALQDGAVNQRFKAGGVTFCTLLPMRAIPFEVVCLLGMNEGDYPRTAAPADFDLMALPGLGRPGDRSRRHDDRQLMLDALLSARRVLHISWAGRSQRDNTEQPPSVLVAQLRDYLDAGWGEGTSAARTVVHPLQPFSRRYFEAGAGPEGNAAHATLFTYASEWRQAHVDPAGDGAGGGSGPRAVWANEGEPNGLLTVTLTQLAALMRHPAKFYFRHRLQVIFGDGGEPELQDDESFDDSALERAQWLRELVSDADVQPLDRGLARLKRAGRLPLASAGTLVQDRLQAQALPMLAERQRILKTHPMPAPAVQIELEVRELGLRLCDTVQGLWQDASAQALAGIDFSGSDLQSRNKPGKSQTRKDKLIACWLKSVACAAAGQPAQWHLIGPDRVAVLAPHPPDEAQALLHGLLRAAHLALVEGRPLATAARTGMAWLESLEGPKATVDTARREAQKAFEGSEYGHAGEGSEDCLRRLYPSFAHLMADPHFGEDTQLLYGPLLASLKEQHQATELPGAAPDVEDSDD